jgi:large subunit ribosomal protein L7e
MKRGSSHIENGTAVQLENEAIENSLGKFNMLCLEDIIYELSNNGTHFNEAMNFLGFFLLSPVDDIKEKVNVQFFRGGSQGFRGDKINDLLKKMI